MPSLQEVVCSHTATPEKLSLPFPTGCIEQGKEMNWEGVLFRMKKIFPLLEWFTSNSLCLPRQHAGEPDKMVMAGVGDTRLTILFNATVQ